QVTGNAGEACQGPVHELRPAIPPSWRRRQLRMGDGAAASSACMPFAMAVSAVRAGLKMKAQSFLAPSPLMSDPTIGVNGAPDMKLPIALTSSPRVTGRVTVPTNA